MGTGYDVRITCYRDDFGEFRFRVAAVDSAGNELAAGYGHTLDEAGRDLVEQLPGIDRPTT